jgi:hypothetical protein
MSTVSKGGEKGMAQPAAFISEGHHNTSETTTSRIYTGSGYRNLSTVGVYVTRGTIPTRAVQSWMGMIHPMNQPYFRLFIENMEVAAAYNQAIAIIKANEGLAKMKFILTIEEDNLPPPDAHIKLLEDMYFLPNQEDVPDEQKVKSPFAGVGALYWTKGEGGQPMIYGNPQDPSTGFAPQIPQENTLQECRGVAMGCNIWDMDLFKDKRLELPGGGFFQTKQEYVPGQGISAGTQDLEFCGRAVALGYRFAVDTRIRVGHLDPSTQIVW